VYEHQDTDDELVELALAVAHPTRPRPFTIAANNERDANVASVAEAHATGAAYAVAVAPDVLAYDLDDEHQADAAEKLHAELTGEGWPALRAASGQPGHLHLVAVVPDEHDRARIARRAADYGLPPPRTVIRPPGAPHRLGLPTQVLDDAAGFTAAAAAARAGTDRTDRLDWRDLLATGRWPRGWAGEGSPSSAVWHICIGAIRVGLKLDDVRGWLADVHNVGGTAYRRRLPMAGKRQADYWLRVYVWPSAERAAGACATPPADATEARERLCALAEAIEAHRWTGTGGATERAVLSVLVARGMARGSLTPVMSHRELAEAVPCSRATVARATRALRAAGWLQMAERGRGSTELGADGCLIEQASATRWRLAAYGNARILDPRVVTPQLGTSLSGIGMRALGSLSSRARLDACRWRGLGLNAPRVLDALASGPRTDAKLAELLGLNRGNLRSRLLPRLAALALVTRTADGWELVENLGEAMAAAADELGLSGKADEVAAQHAQERADYLDERERLRSRREQARAEAIAADVAARRVRSVDESVAQRSERSRTDSRRSPAQTSTSRVRRGPPPVPPPISQEALDASLAIAGGTDAC